MWGELEPTYEDRKGLMAYFRKADRTLLILANLKAEPEEIDTGCEYRVLLDNMGPFDLGTDRIREQTQQSVDLQAWQGMILELIT